VKCSHVPLICDSTSAISVAKNLILHYRTKHIEVRYHFLRDNVEKGNIHLIHVPTEKQLVDILTKSLDVLFFLFELRLEVDAHMHVASSFMYHIMLRAYQVQPK
jgi:hypothetical protein